MANRVVGVVLQAEIGQYISGMTKAAIATKGVGESADATAKKANRGFDLAGRGAMLFGAAAAGALVGVISKSMDFEKAMSGVQAATQASAASLGDLRDAAMRAGADTQYSATEAAGAITEMGKAGVSAGDIMKGGLTGALSLAAAGQLDVAEAAGIASTAMTQFGLSGEQLPHVADLLAAGAGKAMGSVEDMGQALNQAGLMASATGISIEETTGALAAFASAGLIGSDAGTSLKTAIQALANPSKESSELMSQLGIAAYDTNGNFVGLAGLAGQLQDKLGGLTQAQRDQAIAQIFGSDAARVANVLYKEGADGIENWTAKVNDAGYAQEQAAALTDNLAGDLERLGGSFDTLLITLGQGLQGGLRDLTQMFGGLVDGVSWLVEAFTDLPGPLQAAAGAAALWAVAGGRIMDIVRPMGGAVGGMRDTWRAFGEAMDYARANGDGLGTVLRSVGDYAGGAAMGGLKNFARAIGPELAVGGAVLLIGQLVEGFQALTGASDDAQAAAEGLAKSLTLTNDALDREAVRGAIEDTEGLIEMLDRAGVSSTDAIDGLLGQADAQQRVTDALTDYMGTLNPRMGEVTAEDARQAIMAYEELAGGYGNAASSARFFADESANTAEATQGAADATSAAAQQTLADAEAAQKAIEDWIGKLAEIGASFVEPLSIYKTMLQDAAQATADSTESSKDSWQDYADSASISLDQFAQKLEDQLVAQENWRSNLVIVAQRAGYDVAAQLEQMGVEGAGLVAQLANSTDEEMLRMADLMRRDAAQGSSNAAIELDKGMKVMAAIGAAGAGATAAGIATQLQIGAGEVLRIADQYGINLATGLNPLLGAVGKPMISTSGIGRRPGQVVLNADGNLYEQHQAEIAPAGAWRVWAEPETGGEAYIPLAPSKRGRSVDIWRETGRRLGVEVQQFAFGGISDVPKPPSTAPYGPPISTAGDGTMQTGYDAVTAWIQANLLSGGTFGSSRATPNGVGGLGPMAIAARQFVMDTFGIRNIGGYANRNIAGTNVKSDHALGKAIDVMIANYKSASGIAQGNSVASWFVNNPGRFGTKYVIWRDQINEGHGWKPYGHPGGGRSDTLQHRDHVHVSLYDKGGILNSGEAGLNLSGQPERVLNPRETVAYEAGLRSREFSGGGGRWGGSGAVTVNITGATVEGRFEIGGDGLGRIIDGRVVSAVTTIIGRGDYNP